MRGLTVGGAFGVLIALVLVACAESPARDASTIPARVEVICRADESTELSTSSVRAQPDGVHVLVRSQLDEPASVNGLGVYVEPGRRSDVVSIGPGTIGVACWPYPDHGSGEPPTTPLEIVDPDGLYVDPALDCGDGMFGSTANDFSNPGPKGGVAPLEEARSQIGGLSEDDRVVYGGYPEQRVRPVLVVRDDDVIANISFGLLGNDWVQTGSNVCLETGISLEE